MKKHLVSFVIICLMAFTVSASLSAAELDLEPVYINDLEATDVTETSVVLVWTPVPDTHSFRVHYTDENGIADFINLADDADSVKVKNLQPGTTYVFDLEGKCTCAELFSNNVEVTTLSESAPVDPGEEQEPGSGEDPDTGGDPSPGDNPGSGGDPSPGDNPGSGGDPGPGSNPGSGGNTPNIGTGVQSSALRVEDVASGIRLSAASFTVTKSTTSDGRSIATVTLSGSELRTVFELLAKKDDNAQNVYISIEAQDPVVQVQLPLDILKEAGNADAVLVIETGSAGYNLPLSVIDFDALAQLFGAGFENSTLMITLSKLTGSEADLLHEHASNQGIAIIGNPYEFTVTVSGSDTTYELNDFGMTYVARSILLNGSVDGNLTSTAVYDPETGSFSFVPGIYTPGDGKTNVTMLRTGNSIYTVVQANKTFSDIGNHWAKANIELLASKLVIEGRTADAFAPNDGVSRAEFAALLVRALGLKPDRSGASFSDVSAEDWHAGYIGAAVKAGLVQGFEDGTFGPDHKITRAQIAVMIASALNAAGKPLDITGKEDAMLQRVGDKEAIRPWAQNAIAQSLLAGIMTGNPNNLYGPDDYATRAQAAAILKRFMTFVDIL